jgi:glycosyltransferase involved in cell wall biosynthesis
MAEPCPHSGLLATGGLCVRLLNSVASVDGGEYGTHSDDMPQISIITPVWNGLPFIRPCVESVQAQLFQDWELLISDNASDDGTRDYLATLNDPRIRVFYQEHNIGINRNLNFLIEHARAPISQFLCADDYFIDVNSVSNILELWSRTPGVGFIRANWTLDTTRNAREAYACRALPRLVEPQDADLFFFLFGCFAGNTSNISVRTSLYTEVGGLPPGPVGDFAFWIRTARHKAFLLEARNLTYVRSHAGQASRVLNRRGEAISQQFEIVEDLYERLKNDYPVLLLRIHATVYYDALQRWTAVRRLLFDRTRSYFDALRAQTAHRRVFLPPLMRWGVFLLTGGGRWAQTIVAGRLLALHRRSLDKAAANPEARRL